MNHPLNIHPTGEALCSVCEPSWLSGLRSDVRMRNFWDALPRISLAAGQAWCSRSESSVFGWVETGLLATVFVNEQGRERVHQFHPAEHWFEPPLGLPLQAWRIEAQAQSRLLVLSTQQLEEAKLVDERVHDWILQALVAEHQRLIRREHQWLMFSAAERYLKVLQEAPSWLEQVPQHRLASYLGVTDVALSRIRRRLKSRH